MAPSRERDARASPRKLTGPLFGGTRSAAACAAVRGRAGPRSGLPPLRPGPAVAPTYGSVPAPVPRSRSATMAAAATIRTVTSATVGRRDGRSTVTSTRSRCCAGSSPAVGPGGDHGRAARCDQGARPPSSATLRAPANCWPHGQGRASAAPSTILGSVTTAVLASRRLATWAVLAPRALEQGQLAAVRLSGQAGADEHQDDHGDELVHDEQRLDSGGGLPGRGEAAERAVCAQSWPSAGDGKGRRPACCCPGPMPPGCLWDASSSGSWA